MAWLWLASVCLAMPLDQAVDAALERSPTQALAAARVAAADAQLAQINGRLMPSASATAGLLLQNDVIFDIGTTLPDIPLLDTSSLEPVIVQPGKMMQLGAELTQPLVAPVAWAGRGAARKGQDLARATGAVDRRRVERATVNAWHASAQTHALVAQAERAVAQSQALLEKGRALVELGAVAADQILPFQSALANAQANLAVAQAGASSADGVLGQLTGLSGSAEAVSPPSQAPALSDLLSGLNRADLDAAAARVAAAESASAVYRAARLPVVAATGNVTVMDPAPGFAETVSWRVGLVARLPLTQGGTVSAQLDQARAQAGQARAGEALQREQAQIEVRQAHGTLVRALAALDQQAEAVRFARLATEAAERRMSGGGASLLAVQRAQAMQLGAEARLTAASSEAARAADLLRLATR